MTAYARFTKAELIQLVEDLKEERSRILYNIERMKTDHERELTKLDTTWTQRYLEALRDKSVSRKRQVSFQAGNEDALLVDSRLQ